MGGYQPLPGPLVEDATFSGAAQGSPTAPRALERHRTDRNSKLAAGPQLPEAA
ncbi:MAG: hypothetical protein ACJA2W_003613 [Planctomycetota bacterium]|jgi:hypothetical protein